MGKTYPEIGEAQRAFIEKQKMFFVATAPLTGEGHVNLSPKGLNTFRVMGPRQVAYLDLIGSGVETISHIRENGRITLMFCAFEGPPNILRLYGQGRVIEPEDDEWSYWVDQFPEFQGRRSVIEIEVSRVADSCGYSIPMFS
ncbi:MAG: pyridoxamine 5'-phosphate oxidase family protein, partial [Planctomycetota bacterium]|nr:pyridoxamine 5'-phosphate oxidase family protein [Planctomycetota bacterium]